MTESETTTSGLDENGDAAEPGRRLSLVGGGRDWVYRCFVLYNPLFFFSALCVLVGAYLSSRGFAEMGFGSGPYWLALVVQAYEAVLVLGVVMLYRCAGQRRPAVILGLLETLFLFDWTMETEALGTMGKAGQFAVAGWWLMVTPKVALMAWAFRLRPAVSVLVILALGSIGMGATPILLRAFPQYRSEVLLTATWLGVGLAGAVLWMRPAVTSTEDLSHWGRTVLRRAVTGAWVIWGGLYVAHLLAWSVTYEVPISAVQAVPFLLLFAFGFRDELCAWIGSAAAIGIAFADPGLVAPTAGLVAVGMAIQGYRIRHLRLYVGAVLASYFALALLAAPDGAFVTPSLWLSLAASVALFFVYWRFRVSSALFAVGLVMIPGMSHLYPRNIMEWGIAILACGFVALVLGIAINWSQRGPVRDRTPAGP
jgi:hypothetical protein